MTKSRQIRTRYWDKPEWRTSKLLEEEPVAHPSSIKIEDLCGCDALLERLQEVHGKVAAGQ